MFSIVEQYLDSQEVISLLDTKKNQIKNDVLNFRFTWGTNISGNFLVFNNYDAIGKIFTNRMLTKAVNVNDQQNNVDSNIGNKFFVHHLYSL